MAKKNATKQQLNQMRSKLVRLTTTYGLEEIASICTVTEITVRTWIHRGRISKKGAQKVHNSDLPMTRDELRPDVEFWK